MIFFETGVVIFFWQIIRASIREMMAVLTERQLKKLSEHKYNRAGGYTILEPHLQPFWNWAVEKCPLWWAPNAITLTGLIVNIVTALLIIITNPDGTHESPFWAYYLASFGVFVYQTLDCIDGKQARRTGSSSPLGELFDHGCDAVSTVVLTIAAVIHLRLSLEWVMLLVCGAYLAFYVAHWVTYCTGALSFGKIDVIEVQYLMIVGFLISAIFGEDVWLSEVPVLGIKFNGIIIICIFLTGLLQAITAFNTIFVKGGVGRNGSTVADTSVLFPALPIFTVLCLTYMIARKSELSDNVFHYYPCLYLAAFGLVFAKITCKIIVAHMCKSELEFWDSVYFGPAFLFMNQYFDFLLPEYYVLWFSFAYNSLNLIHYAHAVSNQICNYMGIYCFSIQKRSAVENSTAQKTPTLFPISSRAQLHVPKTANTRNQTVDKSKAN